MLDKLLEIEKRYLFLQEKMTDPDVSSHRDQMKTFGKELAHMETIYNLVLAYKKAFANKKEAKEMLTTETDEEMKALAKDQLSVAEDTIADLEEKIKIELLPKDDNDDKNIYLEVRPAA